MTAAKILRLGEGLDLPLNSVTQTLVAYGGKGMGKTNLGAVLVEEMTRGGLRWAWLDPLGVSWGLRHSADGRGPGIECLILGGPKGDAPIYPDGGAAVADVIIEEPHNVLIDFSRKPGGEMWSLGEKVRFVTAYALRLFQRQGELIEGRRREPLFQVLDEAARYIPQVIPAGNPDLARCVGAWEQLVEEGRNIGLGVGLLTQRSARMNKSVSELADAMFAFRTVGPNSLGAVLDWLGEHVEKARIKELGEKVRQLERGHALVVSPGWLRFEGVVHIRLRETFDSSATPDQGKQARTAKGEGARPDLAKIRERMAATIERAKADDPRELRRRIAELEKEARGRAAAPPSVPTPAKTIPILPGVKRLEAAVRSEERLGERLLEAGARSLALAKSLEEVIQTFQPAPAAPWRPMLSAKPFVRRAASPEVRDRIEGNGHLAGPEQRVVDALAELEALGVRDPERVQVAFLAGYSNLASKGFANAMGALSSSGRIVYPGAGRLALTDSGRSLARAFDAPRSSAEIQERVLRLLGGASERILRPLIAAHPVPMSRTALAEAAGYGNLASKGFANAIGRLRSLGFIDYPSQGLVAAQPVLFLEGR